MNNRISYELVIEGLTIYEDGVYDIDDIDDHDLEDHSRIDNITNWDTPFMIAIRKIFSDGYSVDYEHYYLFKNGNFQDGLPKYVVKLAEPFVERALANNNFTYLD